MIRSNPAPRRDPPIAVVANDKSLMSRDIVRKAMRMAAGTAVLPVGKTSDRPVHGGAEISALPLAAEQRGLMGAKDRQMSGRFPSALVAAAQEGDRPRRAHGTSDLCPGARRVRG